jgi:hypothetical protein
MSASSRLVDTLPRFARELETLLTEQNEFELAAQVPELSIVDRCRCGDDFCATFYTQAKPDGSYGPGHRNIALMPKKGQIILDVVFDSIVCVEVLDRDEIRHDLRAICP